MIPAAYDCMLDALAAHADALTSPQASTADRERAALAAEQVARAIYSPRAPETVWQRLHRGH